jgi:hypothetical protein
LLLYGRDTAQAVSAGFLPWRPGFKPTSGYMRFVEENWGLKKVFSEYFGFPCQFSFHRLLQTHHLSSGGWYNRPNSGRRTKWTQSHPTPQFFTLQHKRATNMLTWQMDRPTDGFTCQPIIRYARPILRTGLLHETTRGPHDVGESRCNLLRYKTVQSGLSTDVS